jgi:hypothetical protein
MHRITGGRLGPRACGCFLVAAQPESSANLPLPDYGRVARNPVRINAKRRGGLLQADFPLKYPLRRTGSIDGLWHAARFSVRFSAYLRLPGLGRPSDSTSGDFDFFDCRTIPDLGEKNDVCKSTEGR